MVTPKIDSQWAVSLICLTVLVFLEGLVLLKGCCLPVLWQGVQRSREKSLSHRADAPEPLRSWQDSAGHNNSGFVISDGRAPNDLGLR